MLRKLIIFLILKKLGLKKGDAFQFTNQNSENDYYKFTSDRLLKVEYVSPNTKIVERSGVSLNWILDDSCEIKKIDVEGD